METRVGDIFARDFRVERHLATGANDLFVARRLSTDRHVALKVMDRELSANAVFHGLIRQLAEASAGSRSEHLVEVLASGFDRAAGSAWAAMELLRGEDLDAHVARHGGLPRAVAIELLEQLGDALSDAHARGMVHGDLGPRNVLLAVPRREGVPFTLKVRELGMASALVRYQLSPSSPGRMAGGIRRMLWAVPEWGETLVTLPATDVWPLGLLAFYVLVGQVFWNADRGNCMPTDFLREILADPIPAASARAAELGAPPLPAGFDAWFARCVDRQPDRRFAGAGAAMAALRPLLAPWASRDAALAEAPLLRSQRWWDPVSGAPLPEEVTPAAPSAPADARTPTLRPTLRAPAPDPEDPSRK